MTEQQTETTIEKRVPKICDAVKVVTPDYKETYGLVTAVHGVGYEGQDGFVPPCINVVIVCDDPAKSDTYGRQTNKDLTSLNHFMTMKNMPKPGRYYEFI